MLRGVQFGDLIIAALLLWLGWKSALPNLRPWSSEKGGVLSPGWATSTEDIRGRLAKFTLLRGTVVGMLQNALGAMGVAFY